MSSVSTRVVSYTRCSTSRAALEWSDPEAEAPVQLHVLQGGRRACARLLNDNEQKNIFQLNRFMQFNEGRVRGGVGTCSRGLNSILVTHGEQIVAQKKGIFVRSGGLNNET